MYIGACIVIGIFSSIWSNEQIIPIILLMYAVQRIDTSIRYILEAKYLKNFTKEEMRNKITFTYEFIGGIVASIFSILGGLLLNVLNVENAFLVVGVLFFVGMSIVLNYMRTRFELKSEEYGLEDTEFENSKKEYI